MTFGYILCQQDTFLLDVLQEQKVQRGLNKWATNFYKGKQTRRK